MSSTNKTSLGLNMWEASDKPVRQDFVNDNVIINEKITKLNSDLTKKLSTGYFNIVNTTTILDLYSACVAGNIKVRNGTSNAPSYGWGLVLFSEHDNARLLLVDDDQNKLYLWAITGSETELIINAVKINIV